MRRLLRWLPSFLLLASGCGRFGFNVVTLGAEDGGYHLGGSHPTADGPMGSDPPESTLMEDASTGGQLADSGPSGNGTQPLAPPADFFDLTWESPTPLAETVIGNSCEQDPALDPTLQWLVLARTKLPNPSVADCQSERELHVYAWNGGSPSYIGALSPLNSGAVDEGNPHLVDARAFGGIGIRVVYAQRASPADKLEVVWADLSGTPPQAGDPPTQLADDASDPTLSYDGARLIYTRGLDLHESVRSASGTSYDPARALDELNTSLGEYDAALSPDGRVLVFSRGGVAYVARRADVSSPFESPSRLAEGPGEINEAGSATEGSYIAANGDLLFTSTRESSGKPRVYRARAIMP